MFEISRETFTFSPKEGICGDLGKLGLTKLGRGQITMKVEKVLFPFTLKETENVEGQFGQESGKGLQIN